MTTNLQKQGLLLLRQALDNSTADFRPGQWEAIEELLKVRSQLLVVQRTGWGKSLVYFLATRLLRDQGAGFTVLISPLLALMRNQIAAAQRIGIKAETINSSNPDKWRLIEKQLLAGEIDILLISPERLGNEDFREKILLPVSQRIGLFVVDEAHCISDWGHDFRPDYRRIVRILQALPQNIPVLATTATANNRVVNDIIAQLGSNLRVSRGNLTRESLHLQNISIPSPAARMAWLAQQIPGLPGSGIIYTLTVRDAERVANWLKTQGINAKAYHSDLDSEIRVVLEDELLNNEIKALVATTALGMGFDKPDLGFVIHYQRPGSVVHYYQQVGRAGRAVEKAYGILLSGDEDNDITNYFINTAFPPEVHTQKILNVLNEAVDGFSVTQLEQHLNLSRKQIEKVLKLLSMELPAPITKQDSKWYLTPIFYQTDTKKIEKITQIRRQEQDRILEYMQSKQCLMTFLVTELDDPDPKSCGKCAVCLDRPLFTETYSIELVNEAIQYLRRSNQIISGGARGVDQAAMLAVLDAGGTSVGILADSLTKAAVNSKYRSSIKEGRLTLVSSYDPEASFNTGNAMGRNKYIYALADYALVVSSSFGKGGTWAGAVEALSRLQDIPVFVRLDGAVSEGNQQLHNQGAKPFPAEPWNDSLRELLVKVASWVEPVQTVEKIPQETVLDIYPQNIYQAVLPIILNHLQQPKDAKSLAECLNVRLSQIQDWLNKAVNEGRVIKINRPVTYVVNQPTTQLSLL